MDLRGCGSRHSENMKLDVSCSGLAVFEPGVVLLMKLVMENFKRIQ